MPQTSVVQRPRVVLLMRRPYHHQVSIERVFSAVVPHLAADYDVETVTVSHPSRGLLPRLRAVLEARRHQGDVTHVTGDVHYLTLLLTRSRTLLTVHDTEFLLRAGVLKRALYRWLWLRLPVRRAALVTVPSEATRGDLLAATGAAPERLRVVRNPVGAEFRPGPGSAPGDVPVVLLMGTWPSKNLDRSLEALQGLSVRAVVVGPLDQRQAGLVARSRVPVEHLTDLSDQEVVELYRRCDVLLFPSTAEGFGLPVLEAQASGCPVVTSDREPLRSVSGGAAVLVDPEDVGDIERGLRRVLEDESYRQRLVTAGAANAALYRPESVAAEYAAVYRELLSGARPARRRRRPTRQRSAPS